MHTYKVYEQLLLLWIGLWMHPFISTMTNIAPDFGVFKYKILGNGRMHTMPLLGYYG